MPQDVQSLLDRVCGMVCQCLNRQRLALSKRRHAAAFRQDASDYLPMILPGSAPPTKDLPQFDWREQWYDPAKSLYTQLRNMLGLACGTGDNIFGVRADTGVINCMSVFGAKYAVPTHTKPVVTEYVSKEALREFRVPADVSHLGVMPRVIEHMEHHKAVLRAKGLDDAISVCHCDQQGPFDIAAQARGHDVFTDLYEDAEFVHELMGKCADVYVAVSKLCKKISGEPLEAGNAVGHWMENGGVRMCGDSDILIGPSQYKEFVQPYQQRALAAFGGGWLHYCGGARGFSRHEGLHLHELYAGIAGLRGLNWSTAGDWIGEMRKLKKLGLVHVGGAPRENGESLEQYFRKVLDVYPDRKGLLFHANLKPEDREGAMELWHRLQDQMCR